MSATVKLRLSLMLAAVLGGLILWGLGTTAQWGPWLEALPAWQAALVYIGLMLGVLTVLVLVEGLLSWGDDHAAR